MISFHRPIREEYGKIEFEVKGVGLLKGTPEQAKVLYAKIHSEPLQKIAEQFKEAFIDAGLEKRDDDHNEFLMHMTILNARYMSYKSNKPECFDARDILNRYEFFEFGHQEVEQIHLVDMMKVDADGFYKCI